MRKLVPVLVVVIIGLLIAVNLLGGEPKAPEDQEDIVTPEETSDETETPTETPVEEPEEEEPYVLPSRYSKIPDDLVKVYPMDDLSPPVSESEEYYDPVPVPGLVNTPGGEDSAFVLPDGDTLYFFFTPDVRVPVETQVTDMVTGIYVSTKIEGNWSDPVRILLQEPDKLAMDGCEVIIANEMYFCSAREGYTGLHWFKAEQLEDTWSNWTCIDDWIKTTEYEVGELYITADKQTLLFHSDREGGKGERDIWVSEWTGSEWGEPVNLESVNSENDERYPCLSPDGTELWFSRNYGVWRSVLVDGEWTEPKRMFFPLAGEPTVDAQGNVFFTHHFFDGDTMLEADIYVAYKK